MFKNNIILTQDNRNQIAFEKIGTFISSKQVEALRAYLVQEKDNFDVNYVRITQKTHNTGNKIEQDSLTIEKVTCLHLAIMGGYQLALQALIEQGADVNIPYEEETQISLREYQGFSGKPLSNSTMRHQTISLNPVMLALKNNNLTIAKYLVSHGAEVEFNQILPEHKLILMNECVQYLQKHNQELNKQNTLLKEENKKKEVQLQNYASYLQKSPSFVGLLSTLQAWIRGYNVRVEYKQNRVKRKREKFNELEAQTTQTIVELAQKKRFTDIMHLCQSMLNQLPTSTQEKVIEFKQEAAKTHSTKTYLLLGEGNYSFANSLSLLLEKKQKSHIQLIATDILSFQGLKSTHKEMFDKNYAALSKKSNVRLLAEIDATQIHQNSTLTRISDHFDRIYFNCPHDGKSYTEGTVPKMLSAFFKAAHQVQKPGDKIHMILPKEIELDKQQWRYVKVYNIYENAAQNGYLYIKKLKDIENRYPTYTHTQTKKDSAVFAPEKMREHIFKRSDYSHTVINWVVNPVPFKNKECLPEEESLPLDEMDSDYFSSSPYCTKS